MLPIHEYPMHFINKFRRKAFSVNTFSDIMDVSGGTMKRSLRGWQLLLLGLGTMVGAGERHRRHQYCLLIPQTPNAPDNLSYFQACSCLLVMQPKQTLDESRDIPFCRPAVSMSYLIAGFASTLSALCYAEYACDFPMAGGAFNFITVTFGEFAGWMTAANLFIEWTVANAAVAKGFSGYFSALTNIDSNVFQPFYKVDYIDNSGDKFGLAVNWLSLVFVAVLTGSMLFGTAESTRVQNVSMVIYLLLISFIVFAGASQVNEANYSPFAPFGISGVFRGVTNIFFSYVGFDMVASMAEEAVNPAVDLPIGIIGSIFGATGIYVAMSTVITGMVDYANLDPYAPFAVAFSDIGWVWASKIVAIGALFGCSNSNFGGILGQSRIFVTMGRAGLLPKSMAKMSSRQVPYWSIIASGTIAGILALLLSLNSLWNFVSIGTLFAYGSVCLGCVWRRYVTEETPVVHKSIMAFQVIAVVACGMWAGFGNQLSPGVISMWAVPAGLFFPIVGCFYFFPQRYVPKMGFSCPLMPWVPCGGMMINGFLIGTLNSTSFLFWGIWMAICLVIYLFYGLHHTQGEGVIMDAFGNKIDLELDNEGTGADFAGKAVELDYVEEKLSTHEQPASAKPVAESTVAGSSHLLRRSIKSAE
ncbi:hypothetical protein CEUSTIGMA_g10338.t1 [Chlamydomonas eustigma]|uniref:Cationic amino acid transporter C-terminal domain-containing protein n=1 Tax=Chlamydomonas eustigma TaxID=1157962 RepID=A0A250XJ22_9CHLO|nr:hypothetical protein CEUSTIGMA_g10338.t1 [Chlamydomonas eustigma]|eukprot:GAX82912.1 hypothetical protein CEUSTIGMA_g10338.t1 [Chlamydomonas eustigma]